MTKAARPGEDGGLHAGVRHDAGAVQEELESRREKLGGREQLEKRRGRIRLYIGSMVGLADEAENRLLGAVFEVLSTTSSPGSRAKHPPILSLFFHSLLLRPLTEAAGTRSSGHEKQRG